MKKVLLILGMHRSGTSSLAGGLSACGLSFGDQLLGPLSDNPKGFYEDLRLLTFNDKLLSKMGGSWHQPYRLNFESLISENNVTALSDIIEVIGEGKTVFGIKEPRICLLLPLYFKVFNNLKWDVKFLIITRNDYEIAHSLYKRGNMPVHVGLYLTRFYKVKISEFIKDESVDFLEVNFNKYLKDPYNTFKIIENRMSGFIDANRIQKATGFVDASLKHNQFRVNYSLILNYIKSYLYSGYRLFIRK